MPKLQEVEEGGDVAAEEARAQAAWRAQQQDPTAYQRSWDAQQQEGGGGTTAAAVPALLAYRLFKTYPGQVRGPLVGPCMPSNTGG